jgi:hypothetical protein
VPGAHDLQLLVTIGELASGRTPVRLVVVIVDECQRRLYRIEYFNRNGQYFFKVLAHFRKMLR